MKYDYHTLFYCRVLSLLHGLQGEDGSLYDSYQKDDWPTFMLGWEPRAYSYEHNYLQEKFVNTRDRLLLGIRSEDEGYGADRGVVVMQVSNDDEMTIYKRGVKHIFGKDSKEALEELKRLTEKFYKVKVKSVAQYEAIDFSNHRRERRQTYIHDLRQETSE